MRPSGDLSAPFLKEMEKAFFNAEEWYKTGTITASEEREEAERMIYEERGSEARLGPLI